MITLRNKQTDKVSTLTNEAAERLFARGDQYRTLYEIIQEPPVPKEIKKLSVTKKAESDNDGLSINDGGLPEQDAGEV